MVNYFPFTGYPTMKLFINGGEGEQEGEPLKKGRDEEEENQGRGIRYDGGRTAEDIIEYLKNVHRTNEPKKLDIKTRKIQNDEL